ncbi:major facilitator superfamily domain-containing protein [Fusarium solani]|uniref:Major facilitator superfamily domain-containing protein n=1 Tax=Fusarium solani TaxID=169388 RepID=A0A9P9RBY2_FUSSL|nr:major facilitator superfamily domain-containing protein [Fusarium solani]KAH7273204.1 major facilitator superfamily domain-containing protein [Fusarium solani]
MDILLRESLFGRTANYLTKDKAFPHQRDLTNKESSIELQDSTGQHAGDLEWPRNWPTLVKSFVMADVMLLNFSFYAASAIFTPSIPLIEEKLGANASQGTLGLSLFVIAYGIGPLILSPLSNLPSIGRSPVYVLGSLAFCLINIGTALAKNVSTILVLRFIGGFVGSAPISVGGATLMEIYGPPEVPYAIAFYAVSGVCGPILGPIFGTLAITRWKTWTATLWLLAGITAFTTIFIFFFLPETLMANIQHRRACRLQQENTQGKNHSLRSFFLGVARQTVDDFKLSCMDPVILFVNIHTMLIYGILYLWFELFPFVFGGIYRFDATQQALTFFGILVGAVLSVSAYLLWLYFVYQPRVADPETIVQPEDRLRPGQVGAICIPVCLFVFAWTSRESIHWIVPIIGSGFFAPGFYLTFQSILNYLGESYPQHVAGVFAGNTFFRSSFGGALPLAAPRMLQNLGIGWASSTLGFISLMLVPLPFILERYGKRLRSWSRYAN